MSFQFSSVEPRIHHKKPELQLNVIGVLHLNAVQTTPRLHVIQCNCMYIANNYVRQWNWFWNTPFERSSGHTRSERGIARRRSNLNLHELRPDAVWGFDLWALDLWMLNEQKLSNYEARRRRRGAAWLFARSMTRRGLFIGTMLHVGTSPSGVLALSGSFRLWIQACESDKWCAVFQWNTARRSKNKRCAESVLIWMF